MNVEISVLARRVSLCLTVLGLTIGCSDVVPQSVQGKRETREIPAVAARPSARPNVLLITLDTTRADRIGTYGYERARTPHLDRLASEGVRVAHALASAPITAPAHASILTGLLPPAHGVRDNGTFRLPDEIETLPEILKAEGYATAAFVSAAVLDSRYNLSQGFDRYDDDLWSEDTPPMFMIRERHGARTAAVAIDWLKAQHAARPEQPFFLWVHFFDVHEPHEPAPADAVLCASLYDAEITGVDRHVGALLGALSSLGVAERTLSIVTADHGESLGEHGESTHGIFVYESTIRIPLLLRWPQKLPRGRVFEGTAHQIDLFPTILAATGTKARRSQGTDLLSALAAGAPLRRVQYAESKMSELGFGMAPLHAVRDATHTYIRAPRPELYDRHSDPHEKKDLSKAQPELLAKLSAELDRVLAESASFGFEAAPQPIDQHTEEMLRALGYVGDTATREQVAAMDPKDGVQVYEQLHKARHSVRAGRHAEAIVQLKTLLKTWPRNVSAINVLALAEQKQGRHEAALARCGESLAIEPHQPRVQLQIASLLLDSGKADSAIDHAKEALRMSPGFVEALVVLGFAELTRGNRQQADAYYAEAQKADPNFPRAQHAYADMYFRQRKYADALAYYKQALERSPKNFALMIQAGASARRTGDMEAALEYYRQAAELRPDSWVPPYNSACIHASTGARADALADLQRAVERNIADPDILTRDPDLAALQKDPAFLALVSQAQAGWRKPRASSEEVPTLAR